MRPHVEPIAEDDYIWYAAELPTSEAVARQRNLSVDEEDGNIGDLDPGTYFFRPARVKHGHFVSGEPEGCTWLIRSDGDLVNWYTTGEHVHFDGEAENYDKTTQGPILASLSVRSRSRGPWSGDGM